MGWCVCGCEWFSLRVVCGLVGVRMGEAVGEWVVCRWVWACGWGVYEGAVGAGVDFQLYQ